ncbi:MAG: arginine--tRNA ligase, partial [Parcubacteria group bacterium]|nr:arginine--tRNA ligase [Parcubacteria group bacterium]
MKKEIGDLLIKSVKISQSDKSLPDFNIPEIQLEHPENRQFGDYSSNIAMQIVKKAKKSPLEIAEIIKNNIEESKNIEKVEVVKPGFINFYLSNEY